MLSIKVGFYCLSAILFFCIEERKKQEVQAQLTGWDSFILFSSVPDF